ncbi:MAG: chitinase [Patescibacteria group bacterium]
MSRELVARRMQSKSVKTRRLSPWRVLFGVTLLVILSTVSVFGMQQWRNDQSTATREPWFAPYIDVTATPSFAFEQMGSTDHKDAVLSFIVSSTSKGACVPSWGGVYTLEEAGNDLDLDRRIARLKQKGGNVAISFGGLNNKELAVTCTDTKKLKAAYGDVIERYDINTIDLDLEKDGLKDLTAATRRAEVLKTIQSERRAKGEQLAIWVTVPVAPQGLTKDSTDALAKLLSSKVDLAGINLMTMDYGGSKEKGVSMLDASISALKETHRQLSILYEQAGVPLTDATIWSKLGATPMIGQNDVAGEIFSLEDAEGLNAFAKSKRMGRMSSWSANRDAKCGDNYVDIKVVSDSCSGVDQEKGEFGSILGNKFSGNISSNAGTVTTSNAPSQNEKPEDNPADSPYQIWSESGAYLEGTKVVWHKNVYEAKWWNQGTLPDNPVLQSWETPWRLIGPVLPGEKPIEQAKLPDGTYPEWSGVTAYEAGTRVLFNGIPYQAKWWNEGDSPAAASSNATSSPWVPLTQAQITALNLP